eukprot:gene7738-914_t
MSTSYASRCGLLDLDTRQASTPDNSEVTFIIDLNHANHVNLDQRQHEPTRQQHKPTLQQNKPTLQQSEPTLQQHKPTLQQNEPTLQQNEPTLEQHEPIMQWSTGVVTASTNCALAKSLYQPVVSREYNPVVQVSRTRSTIYRSSRHLHYPDGQTSLLQFLNYRRSADPHQPQRLMADLVEDAEIQSSPPNQPSPPSPPRPPSDLYGFPLPQLSELQAAERKLCDDCSDSVTPLWMEYIQIDSLPSSETKVKDIVRKGVPPPCRTWVWMTTSGASKKKAAAAGNYYQIMVSAGIGSSCLANIEQDCQHTFPTHAWIQTEDGQAALTRVLSAYSMHNDKVGYCRSMNVIVGLLLIAMNRNEENAFWLLSALVEDILYPGTYSRNLEGCQIEMNALDELISNKLPRLHAHLNVTDCDISILATDWYLCLFASSVPSETALRVWDALFNEGPKILFRVGLAILKSLEEQILACDNSGDIVMLVRGAAQSMHNRDKLMSVAFDGVGSLPMATIDKFRVLKQKEFEERGGSPPPASKPTKTGFGKFMGGMNKWADKTAESMSKAAAKMGIEDKTGGAPAK